MSAEEKCAENSSFLSFSFFAASTIELPAPARRMSITLPRSIPVASPSATASAQVAMNEPSTILLTSFIFGKCRFSKVKQGRTHEGKQRFYMFIGWLIPADKDCKFSLRCGHYAPKHRAFEIGCTMLAYQGVEFADPPEVVCGGVDNDFSRTGTGEKAVRTSQDRCYGVAVKKVENDDIDAPDQVTWRLGDRHPEIGCLCRGPVPDGQGDALLSQVLCDCMAQVPEADTPDVY